MRNVAAKSMRASARHATAPGEPTPRASRPLRGAALWASIGFVCGAVFWHAVGFWTFVSELVLNGEVAAAHDGPVSGEPLVTGSLPTIYHVDPQSCVTLELDRLSNRTTPRPCPRDGLALRLESKEMREDLVFIADGSDR